MHDFFDLLDERVGGIMRGDTDPHIAIAWFVLAIIAMAGWRHLMAHMR